MPYSTMPNCLLQIYFFHRNFIYVYLKNSILCCIWRDLNMSLPLCQSHWFASQKFALILPGTYSSSQEEKKTDKVCIWKVNHSILSETGKITHRFFYKSMFSEDGLKCHPKHQTVFLRKHRFVEKKNVLFCRLSLYISLKQI